MLQPPANLVALCRLSPVWWWLSGTVITPDVPLQGPNREELPLPVTCWPHSCLCRLRCVWPSLPQAHFDALCSVPCALGPQAPSFAELLPGQSAPPRTVIGLVWPMYETIFVLNFLEFLLSSSFSLLRSPGTAAQLSCLSLCPPAWCPSAGHFFLAGKWRRTVDKLWII